MGRWSLGQPAMSSPDRHQGFARAAFRKPAASPRLCSPPYKTGSGFFTPKIGASMCGRIICGGRYPLPGTAVFRVAGLLPEQNSGTVPECL